MINAGANLITYPDLVLVLAGHGIEKKNTAFTEQFSWNSLQRCRKTSAQKCKALVPFFSIGQRIKKD